MACENIGSMPRDAHLACCSKFSSLPHDVLLHLLQACGARSVGALSCCGKMLRQMLCSDAELWRALIRQRYHALFGDAAGDPHQALLPSYALERCGTPSPHRCADAPSTSSPTKQQHQRWPQLFQECEREWLEAQEEPTRGATWTVWLAWQRRFAPPSSQPGLLAMSILFASSGHGGYSGAQAERTWALCDLCALSFSVAAFAYAWYALQSP